MRIIGKRVASARSLRFAAVLALVASGCSSCPGPQRASGRTVRDLAGRQVTVPENVERLIAIGPGSLRLVAYLGAVDRVVGLEEMEKRMARDPYVRPYAATLDDDFLRLPVVGAGGAGVLPDAERVMLCRPDLLVVVALDPGQVDNLQERTGVPALYLSYGELGVWRAEARVSLSLLGEVLGLGERAARLEAAISSLQEDLERRTSDLPEKDRPFAYFGGLSYKGSHGLDSTEAGYLAGRMAGARNLADTVGPSGHFFVDREKILAWNPDFLFIDASSRLIVDEDLEHNRDFYRLLDASRAGRAYSLLPYNAYNTNVELALINAYFIGKTLYPGRFGDVEIAEKARDIIETFLGFRPAGELPACRPLRFPETGPVEWN
ncbi:MAG: iron ABC transporter substrate-binding protein [Deltaproteobacteria bacterium]|nr:iron ABC transporter substrate-binding protein [Deltaproteobacteria bacterium]